MKKPMIRIHDVQSNEIIDREMTDAEFEVYEAGIQADAIIIQEKRAQADFKTSALAKLAALGLTEDEAKAIIG